MALYPFYPPTISSASVGAVKSVHWLSHASPVHSIMSVRPQRNKPSRSWVELWVYSTVRILSSTLCSGRGMCSSYGEARRSLEDSPCWVVLGAAQNPPTTTTTAACCGALICHVDHSCLPKAQEGYAIHICLPCTSGCIASRPHAATRVPGCKPSTATALGYCFENLTEQY